MVQGNPVLVTEFDADAPFTLDWFGEQEKVPYKKTETA
jgi:hypothetical protein